MNKPHLRRLPFLDASAATGPGGYAMPPISVMHLLPSRGNGTASIWEPATPARLWQSYHDLRLTGTGETTRTWNSAPTGD